ncbi:MAG TPA: 4'-phosphopantetheinyl transferase superfamily protein [Acidimicrobiales bacterium]|jgi:4'-phosphopantetheinyl transferase|nr:4'-phosphopantetheinyl transferase superfamily protein [Acidimicrobiales bacterium]
MSEAETGIWEQDALGPDLPRGEVHIWRAEVDTWEGSDDDLSDEERARAARFRFDRDRRRWTAAHLLVRRVLARYLSAAPAEIALGADENGRPLVLWPSEATWLCFSLSHAGNVALVAVTREQGVGVDVEELRSDVDAVAVAERAFGDAVASALAGEPEPVRTQRFFEVWTREEARGKCRGTGLLEPDDARRLEAAEVTDLEMGHRYVAAVAGSHRPGGVRTCLVAL